MTAHLVEPNPENVLVPLEAGDPRDLFWRGWHDGVVACLDALGHAGHVDEIAGVAALDDDCRVLRRQARGVW